MSGNSVENSQANCSPRGWFRVTLKDRALVVKMKGREGGRERRPNGHPAGSYNTKCGSYFRKTVKMLEKNKTKQLKIIFWTIL
jgi:hypothetical protein